MFFWFMFVILRSMSYSIFFRGVTWFLAAEVVIMALLIAFPAISTFLPYMM